MSTFSFLVFGSARAFILTVCLLFAVLAGFSGCEIEQQTGNELGEEISDTLFVAGLSQGTVENDKIREASGMAAGIRNEHALWVHNDSGNKARIFLMSENGAHLGLYYLENKKNRDWEDMASGPGPEEGTPYLYLADIGDNDAQYPFVRILRFKEPLLSGSSGKVQDTIPESEITEIILEYPDGARDAECFLLDPLSKGFYIISKREQEVLLYYAPFPHVADEVMMLEKVAELPFHSITAGDISADGSEILIKDYTNIYYWKRAGEQDLKELLLTAPVLLPYAEEPQGEAIAWKKDGSGFFTISEELFFQEADLKYYHRFN